MKARLLAVLLALLTFAALQAPSAQASIQPIIAVDSFFAALDSGDHEAAAAMFSPDAVATLARGETYQGSEGIRQLVQLMEHPGRRHEIIQTTMIGDTVTVVVAISDRGVRWGEEKVVFELQGGKLHTFREQSLHLLID